MRVGVYLGGAGPEHGGIHTFVGMQRDALLELAPASAHRFVLLASSAAPASLALPDNVEYVHLHEPPPAPTSPLPPRGLFGGLRRRRHRRRHAQPTPGPVDPIERAIAEHDLDCVWPLEAWHPPFEVPYLTIVWDLQHRLQPFFPEVSRGGTWRDREARLAPLLRRAAYVIVGTEAGRAEVERFYQVPRERIRILPHPTPPFALAAAGAPAPPVPARFDLPPGYLLYPAQFWAHKNHVGLLQALRLLREEHGLALPLALTGADQGNLATVRRSAHALGLEGQVHLLGLVSTEELVALYRNALALAYVSLFGPENLPPLEAFALGCPVIAADVSGSAEQLGDAALRVDALDARALAAALRRVHDDADLRAILVERGRTRAGRWTAPDFVRGVLAILDEFGPRVATWRGVP